MQLPIQSSQQVSQWQQLHSQVIINPEKMMKQVKLKIMVCAMYSPCVHGKRLSVMHDTHQDYTIVTTQVDEVVS